MNGKEVNNCASKIADTATEMLVADGVKNAAVVVTYGPFYDWPLSIRTPMGDGFGAETDTFGHLFNSLLEEARLQAKYGQTVAGRSASEQLARLQKTERSATSYGSDFNAEFKPNFAFDPIANLTLVVVSKGIDEKDSVKISEEAITKTHNGHLPEWTEARYFLNYCLGGMNQRLPEDKADFSMIALPTYRVNKFNNANNKATIVCSQSDGLVIDPSVFSIVEAKAKATAISGIPSGVKQNLEQSRIDGAVPILVPNHGERIVANGGLPDCKEDVEAIKFAVKFFSPRMQISILEQLTSKTPDRLV